MKLTLDPEDVAAIARAVVAELRAGATNGMVDQAGSALGRRRHIAAVRRRVAAGDAGAVVLGRNYLLSQEAHAEEIRRIAATPKKRTRREQILEKHGLTEERAH
jgi:hypothetical protein